MPQRELIGPNAPEEAARPLTGTEVLHVVDEDGNSKVTTTAAIAEDLGSGGASAITSPDASAAVTALDDGQVVTTIGGEVIETVEEQQRSSAQTTAGGRTFRRYLGDASALPWLGTGAHGDVTIFSTPGAVAPSRDEDDNFVPGEGTFALLALGQRDGMQWGFTLLVADAAGVEPTARFKVGKTAHGWGVFVEGAPVTTSTTQYQGGVAVLGEDGRVERMVLRDLGFDAPRSVLYPLSLTLDAEWAGQHTRLAPADAPLVVTVDAALFAAVGNPDDYRGFQCSFEIVGASFPTSFAATGGLVLSYHGKSSGWAVGDQIELHVTSPTTAVVKTTSPGELATASNLGTHTSNTSNPHSVTAAQIGAATTGDLATVSGVANAALPKPGGTTTDNGIVTGSGTTGAAVAVTTTLIADLVKRLGNVFTLSANTVLDDSYSGSVIFVDTTLGARTLTIPPTLAAGWNAVIVREGANTLNIVGSTVGADTMLMKGPAAAANAVAIAVDDGGVSVIRRSATKCWCAGKVS